MGVRAKQVATATIVLVLAIGLTTVAQSSAGRTELRRLGVIAAPESLTELYFVRPLELPYAIRREPQVVRLAFRIGNRSPRLRRISWRVVVDEPPYASRTYAQGTVGIAPHDRATVPVRLALPGCTGPTTATLSISSGESLHFVSPCTPLNPSAQEQVSPGCPPGTRPRTPAFGPGGATVCAAASQRTSRTATTRPRRRSSTRRRRSGVAKR